MYSKLIVELVTRTLAKVVFPSKTEVGELCAPSMAGVHRRWHSRGESSIREPQKRL
jgi:hypothetical protein